MAFVRDPNKYYPIAFFNVKCPHCKIVMDRIRFLTLGSVIWCEKCGKTFDKDFLEDEDEDPSAEYDEPENFVSGG